MNHICFISLSITHIDDNIRLHEVIVDIWHRDLAMFSDKIVSLTSSLHSDLQKSSRKQINPLLLCRSHLILLHILNCDYNSRHFLSSAMIKKCLVHKGTIK